MQGRKAGRMKQFAKNVVIMIMKRIYRLVMRKGMVMISLFSRKWAVGLIVFCLAILFYLPALRNDFVNWDDDIYVYDNPAIRTLDIKAVAWMFTTSRAGNWHPLTWMSHSVDCALWGLNPFGHHLTNMVVHGLNTLMVFLLVLQLLRAARKPSGEFVPDGAGAIRTAGITALLFGLHPLHVESVAWVSERKDLLCAFFVLLSVRAYVAYAAAPGGGRKRFGFTVCVVCAALALMAKPMAVSIPLVLLVIDAYPLRRFSGGAGKTSRVLLEKIPFTVMSAASTLLTLRAAQAGKSICSVDVLPLQARLLNGMHSLAFYLQKMLVPGGLSPLYLYPHPSTIRWSDGRYLVSIMVIVLITAGCWGLSRRGKHLLSAVWAYYLATLLPVIGVVQVGIQAAADRYTYLPSISIFLLAGVGVSWSWNGAALTRYPRFWRGSIVAALCFVFAALGMLTIRQIGVWQTPERFWNYVVEHAPVKNPLAYNNLGNAVARAGRLGEAIAAYEQALAVMPNDVDALNNLGIVYARSGDVDGAIAQYKRALAYAPDYARAHYNLANAYRTKGLLEEAVAEYEKALSIDPGYAQARDNLAEVAAQKRIQDQKIRDYESSLAANPADAVLHNKLGDLYIRKGMVGEGIAQLKRAIALRPDYALAYNYLAWIYATSLQASRRNGKEAVALAGRACELTGFQNPDFLDTLAAAYAEAGDFAQAVSCQEKAISLGKDKDLPAMRVRLRRYQSGQAYRSY